MVDKLKEELKIRRSKVVDEPEEQEPQPVTQGSVDKVIDLAFNPTREKIREVTIVDRIQARLLPQLDLVALVWDYCIQITLCRKNSAEYERVYKMKQPIPPDLINEFMYRTAQWQKSVQGKNLERATDIALAETETKNDSMGFGDADGGWTEK